MIVENSENLPATFFEDFCATQMMKRKVKQRAQHDWISYDTVNCLGTFRGETTTTRTPAFSRTEHDMTVLKLESGFL